MRDSKNILYSKLGVTPMERQYGGGLDDAYMNRRRSSAFADPNATSAFANPNDPSAFIPDRFPVSSNKAGGLPTIYRANGGGYEADDYGDYTQDDIDAAMADNNSGAESEEQDAGAGNYPSFSSSPDPLSGDYYTGPGLEQGLRGVVPSTPSAPSAPSDSDDESNYVTDERYAQLYGRSGDSRPSFTESGEFIYGRPGGPPGPSQQDYINRLNKEGFPKWTWPYYNDAKSRGMTNDEATAYVAAAMSTPGGISGMQSGNYSFGGPMGTMQDLLEKGMVSRANIDKLIEEDKDIKAYNKDDDEEFLSQGELVASGLKGVADDVSNLVSLKANLTPTTMELIDSKFTEAGLNFTPASGTMGTVMNFLVPSVAKGLSNLTGAGRTIGTVTDPKTGLSFNVSDTGKFSLNLPPAEVDYGNDPTPVKKRKPVQKAVASTTEEKPKEGIAGYYERLNKARPAQSRVASNKYIEDLLKYSYPDPRNRPTLG